MVKTAAKMVVYGACVTVGVFAGVVVVHAAIFGAGWLTEGVEKIHNKLAGFDHYDDLANSVRVDRASVGE